MGCVNHPSGFAPDPDCDACYSNEEKERLRREIGELTSKLEKAQAETGRLAIEVRDLKMSLDEQMKTALEIEKQRDDARLETGKYIKHSMDLKGKLDCTLLQNHDLVEAVRELLRVKVCGSAEEAVAREKVKALLPPLTETRVESPEPRFCVKCGATVERGNSDHPYSCTGTGNAANPAERHDCVGVRFCAICNVRL